MAAWAYTAARELLAIDRTEKQLEALAQQNQLKPELKKINKADSLRRFPPAPPGTRASTSLLREVYRHPTCGPLTPSWPQIMSMRDPSKRPSACFTIHDFIPYKDLFLESHLGSKTSYTCLPNLGLLTAHPHRNWKELNVKNTHSTLAFKLTDLVQALKTCYQLTTTGKFTEAIEKLQHIILCIPLLVVESRQEIAESQQLLTMCREYVVGLQMEPIRKGLPKSTLNEQKRICELAAYFTHVNLQPVHQILTLRTALNLFFKLRNYKTAASFARRLLELGPRPEVAQPACKILQACEMNETRTRSRTGRSTASYLPPYKGVTCAVCRLAEVVKDVIELRISASQFK